MVTLSALEKMAAKEAAVTGDIDTMSIYGGDETYLSMASNGDSAKPRLHQLREQLQRSRVAIRRNPWIVVIPLMLFLALLGSGLALIRITSRAQNKTAASEARLLALETGEWFASQLDLAIAPLFSLAQFVKQLDELNSLADEIGVPGDMKGAPFLPPKDEDSVPTHRNITGVCDDPNVLKRFNEIAAAIKKSADMEKVLVNLQVAPQAVVCMAYPLNNTEDFEDGKFLDSNGAIGHDLLNDPARSFIARATVPSDRVVIAGPLTLRQCSECPPTVKEAFIARLPIESESHEIVVDGVSYKKWGFAVALINWAALVERSNIYEQFAKRDFSFKLTRTDRIEDKETGEITLKEVVLAESDDYEDKDGYVVSTELQTTNNDWVMAVNYSTAAQTDWVPWGIFISVCFALCFAVLAYIVLLQKQVHSDLDAEKTNLLAKHAEQAARNQRDLNEFLAHEIRNPLAAAISACTFVSYALQHQAAQQPQPSDEKTEAAPAAADAPKPMDQRKELVEDVTIIETSLRFINELLRSILDTNRAANKSMVLDNAEIDVRHDIFEPVTSMVYQRDDSFEFEIECPEGMLIDADRLRLQQVILNLCRNSAKFVEHGFIRLRALDIKGANGSGRLVLYVEDSGPGIPAEKRQNLFRRFQESLDTMAQGTGVGLNLCRQIVELMGGTIRADDNYDSGIDGCPGTRIIIELNDHPVRYYHRQEASPHDEECSVAGSSHVPSTLLLASGGVGLDSTIGSHESAPYRPEAPGAARVVPEGLSVLFVDDDRVLRKMATRSISKAFPDFKVREAASGETALQLIDTDEFDMIFVDQYMTSVNQALKGTETVRAMRAKGSTSLICGLSANNMEASFISSGADAFLLKPFPCKTEEISAKVTALWRSRESNNRAAEEEDETFLDSV